MVSNCNCKSAGKPFHRIIARGKKLVRVDVRLPAGTGYELLRKLYPERDVGSGRRLCRYFGDSRMRILKNNISVK